MVTGLMKLPEDGVRRNYIGGTGIDRLHGEARQENDNTPEEWVGSTVEVSSPGIEPIARKGMTVVETAGGSRFLRDIINDDRKFYLGAAGREEGWRLNLLLKVLDSAVRLHVQAHPSIRFVGETAGMPYGKLECYYIFHVRDSISPYIRLGFQHTPERGGWREIVEKWDRARMDGCFEEIPMQVGEVWYIPGGMSHTTGGGITMLEIMEPPDLVTRCEFERGGIAVPESGRFMGRGLDSCLNIFDYAECSKEEIMEECRIEPRVLEATGAFRRVRLVDGALTSCFFAEKLEVNEPALVGHNRRFNLGVVCAGSYTMEESEQVIRLKAGDSFPIATGVKAYQIRPEGNVQVVMVYPEKDMNKL